MNYLEKHVYDALYVMPWVGIDYLFSHCRCFKSVRKNDVQAALTNLHKAGKIRYCKHFKEWSVYYPGQEGKDYLDDEE